MDNLNAEEITSIIASNDYWITDSQLEWLFHWREGLIYERE